MCTFDQSVYKSAQCLSVLFVVLFQSRVAYIAMYMMRRMRNEVGHVLKPAAQAALEGLLADCVQHAEQCVNSQSNASCRANQMTVLTS